MYSVIFIATLEGISSIIQALTAEGDVVQSGVVALSDSQHGKMNTLRIHSEDNSTWSVCACVCVCVCVCACVCVCVCVCVGLSVCPSVCYCCLATTHHKVTKDSDLYMYYV